MTWQRWGLPMWVTPLLLASVGLIALVDWFWASARTRWVPVVAFVVVAVQFAVGTATADEGLVASDTRVASLHWLDDRGIRACETTYEGYTPYLPGAPYTFGDTQVSSEGDRYVFRTKKGRPAKYVILSDGMYARVLRDPTEVRDQEIYHYIFDNFDEVKVFKPFVPTVPSVFEPVSVARHLSLLSDLVDGASSGPTIKIYEIPEELRATRS